MTHNSFFYLLLSILFFAACDRTSQTSSTLSEEAVAQALEKDKSAIQEIIIGYENALEQRNPAACASIFANDGILLANGSEALTGDGILGWYQSLIPSISAPNVETWHMKINIQEIEVHHDWAYARSENSGVSVVENQSADWTSLSVFMFVRQNDGLWKVKTYMFYSVDNNEEEG